MYQIPTPHFLQKVMVIEATTLPVTPAICSQVLVHSVSPLLLEPFPFTGGTEETAPGHSSPSLLPLPQRSVVTLDMLQVTLADYNISKKYRFAALNISQKYHKKFLG